MFLCSYSTGHIVAGIVWLLVYTFKIIVGNPYFSDKLKKPYSNVIKKVEVNMDIMQQSACLFLNPKAVSIVAQLEVFFSSDYLRVMGPFLCFIIVC